MCMNTELKLHKKTFAELTLDELYELLNLRYLYARRHSAHKNDVGERVIAFYQLGVGT